VGETSDDSRSEPGHDPARGPAHQRADGTPRSPRSRWRRASGLGRTFVATWAIGFVLLGLLGTGWVLATPHYAWPDAPSQVARSVASVRGQLVGQQIPGRPFALTEVRIPATYTEGYRYLSCFNRDLQISAACAPHLVASAKPTLFDTYDGHYPPLYYLLVGLPSLLTTSEAGVTLMCIASALLSAAYLSMGLAAALTWGRSRLLPAGIALSVTPMVLFLSASVNPNGFEIAAAAAVWACGITLVLHEAEQPPALLVAALAIAAATLVQVRQLSPFWLLLIGIVLAVLAGRRRLGALLQCRSVQLGLAVVALSGVVALAWILGEHALVILPTGSKLETKAGALRIFLGTIGLAGPQLRLMVLNTGWFGPTAPELTFMTWIVGVGALGVLALATGTRRAAWAVALCAALVVLGPAFVSALAAHADGLSWQARYTLPFAVGLPLLAAAVVPNFPWTGRLSTGLLGATAAAQLVAYVVALGRYVAGFHSPLQGPLSPLAGTGPIWAPPLPAVLLVGAEALLWLFVFALLRSSRPATPASHLRRPSRRRRP